MGKFGRLIINFGKNIFLNCLEIFCKQTNLLNESYKNKIKVIEIMCHVFPIGISIELHKEIMIKLKLICLCITRSKLAWPKRHEYPLLQPPQLRLIHPMISLMHHKIITSENLHHWLTRLDEHSVHCPINIRITNPSIPHHQISHH